MTDITRPKRVLGHCGWMAWGSLVTVVSLAAAGLTPWAALVYPAMFLLLGAVWFTVRTLGGRP